MAPPDGAAVAVNPSGTQNNVAAALDARLAELRLATAQWGDTQGPEARMISAMIGTIAELSVITRRMELTHEQAGDRVMAAIGGWETKGAKVYDEMLTVMGQGRAVTGSMDEALKRFEKEARGELPDKVASMMAPNLVRALVEPIQARLSLHNREDLLRLWLRAGGVAVALAFVAMVFGYVMGARAPSFTDMQVDWCEQHPIVSGSKGYCDLDRLRPMWRQAAAS